MFIHTSIRTNNMDRSISFYKDFLGLEVMNRIQIPSNNAEIVFLKDPDGKGSTLEITYYRDQKTFKQADYEHRLFDHIAFEVKDMEKIINALRKTKITITDEPFSLGSKGPLIAFIEDPNGILIELVERKKSN